MIMNESERIKKIIHELNMTEKAFADSIGIDAQLIGQWKKFKTPVSPKALIAIMNKYRQFNPYWITSGDGEMNNVSIETSINTSGNKNTYGKIRIGDTSRVNDPESNYELIESLRSQIIALKQVIEAKDELISALKSK